MQAPAKPLQTEEFYGRYLPLRGPLRGLTTVFFPPPERVVLLPAPVFLLGVRAPAALFSAPAFAVARAILRAAAFFPGAALRLAAVLRASPLRVEAACAAAPLVTPVAGPDFAVVLRAVRRPGDAAAAVFRVPFPAAGVAAFLAVLFFAALPVLRVVLLVAWAAETTLRVRTAARRTAGFFSDGFLLVAAVFLAVGLLDAAAVLCRADALRLAVLAAFTSAAITWIAKGAP